MTSTPYRIFLIGIMGAGKSYWANMLGSYFGVPVFDTDNMVEELAGETISNIFLSPDGEDIFREMERRILHDTAWPEVSVVACGGGLPCFHNNMDWMLQNGLVIWLNPDTATLTARLWEGKSHRPLVAASDSREDLQHKITGLINGRKVFYGRAHIILEGTPTLEGLVESINSFQPSHK